MTWQPLRRADPVRQGQLIDTLDEELWANDLYAVHKRVMRSNDPELPDAIHLSIRNQDRSARHDWRDFQRIKNQLAGPEWEAVEIYPAESRLVDMANQFHLWCFQFDFGFGFHEGRKVGNQAQADIISPGAVQRDPEPVDGPLSRLKDMKYAADNYGKIKEEKP